MNQVVEKKHPTNLLSEICQRLSIPEPEYTMNEIRNQFNKT
jgi:hypothetical protein